jgi:aspartyl-tRNA synthetase
MSTRATWQRTHTAGALRVSDVGSRVTLNGWVHARRDHGGIYFVDLRDRYGITQVVLSEEVAGDVRLGPEDVISVTGEVVARDEANCNPDRATGDIELVAESVEMLAASKVPPFEIIDDLDTALETRLRHRYLDLRRRPMLANLEHRSRFINAIRNAFFDQDFTEVETPILTRATPEGARDYLVPSRVHPGNFYALPQSPQLFKQILMVAGLDKYFQVARCFRDEDLRADRQPEFTQLDMEMSFVEEEDVFSTWERVLERVFREVMDVQLVTPFPRLTYADTMERYGSDKPDTRFAMELVSLDEWARGCAFQIFSSVVEGGGRVLGLTVKGGGDLSRKQIGVLEEVVKTYGAKGLAWWKPASDQNGGGSGPLARFVEGAADGLMETLAAEEGDLCLFVADSEAIARRSLGELREHLGRERGLAAEGRWDFLWVTCFPMFEADAEANDGKGGWSAVHHPFTAPEDWEMEGDPGQLGSRAYDLVLNGWELGSGSIRIHRQDVQARVFELLGIDSQEQRAKFGFLLDALEHGAPPHGGFAVGLDRLVAMTLGLDNIRDVVAFPKTASATDLMCQAPSPVSEDLLREVHVSTILPAARAQEHPAGGRKEVNKA